MSCLSQAGMNSLLKGASMPKGTLQPLVCLSTSHSVWGRAQLQDTPRSDKLRTRVKWSRRQTNVMKLKDTRGFSPLLAVLSESWTHSTGEGRVGHRMACMASSLLDLYGDAGSIVMENMADRENISIANTCWLVFSRPMIAQLFMISSTLESTSRLH